ncbi:MAG: glycosyltransferase family 2 protein [Planctomycetes bacterium]|nr:glycosyltransferase family 2 protein [Planctomycetota bacterium]
MGAPAFSVVVPVYNEEENLPILIPAVVETMEAIGRSYEVLLIDDGSTDRSYAVMLELKQSHPSLRCLKFRANAGQTAAMAAGFEQARGDVVITLDADLQNDPADIPKLLEKLDNYDAACGWRHDRQDSPWRLIQSRIANWVRNKLSGERIVDTGCSLKAYKRECLAKLKLYNGLHRFLPTLIKMEGYTVTEVKVSHHPRRHGEPKYGMWNRALPALRDLLTVRWMKKRHLNYEIEEER